MAAEAEIKLREEADETIAGEEVADKLKAQIKKQRQEIMKKTAAATSGISYYTFSFTYSDVKHKFTHIFVFIEYDVILQAGMLPQMLMRNSL